MPYCTVTDGSTRTVEAAGAEVGLVALGDDLLQSGLPCPVAVQDQV
jgi:hypothetical protein